jgi:hypothetical protein
MSQISDLERRVSRIEKLLYIVIAAIISTHFIDPTLHYLIFQFP